MNDWLKMLKFLIGIGQIASQGFTFLNKTNLKNQIKECS